MLLDLCLISDIRDVAANGMLVLIALFDFCLLLRIYLDIKVYARADQERRNRLARLILQAYESETPSEYLSGYRNIPFILYLRPFAIEHRFRGFDGALANRLGKSKIFSVSIGDTNESVGAGRIETDDTDWVQIFRTLAARAEKIIMIPSASKGVITEIRWLIVSGLISKTVFFKPDGYPRRAWIAARKDLENLEEIFLPDFTYREISFSISSRGNYFDLLFWKSSFFTFRKKGNNQS